MIRINKLTYVVKMKKWEGVHFRIYDYSGEDGRKVTSWIMHFGFFRIVRERIASNYKKEKLGQCHDLEKR